MLSYCCWSEVWHQERSELAPNPTIFKGNLAATEKSFATAAMSGTQSGDGKVLKEAMGLRLNKELHQLTTCSSTYLRLRTKEFYSGTSKLRAVTGSKV